MSQKVLTKSFFANIKHDIYNRCAICLRFKYYFSKIGGAYQSLLTNLMLGVGQNLGNP